MKLKIALIRHGKTENASVCLLGAGDNPLSGDGKALLREKCGANAYPAARHVYSSELLCCRETASLIYMSPILLLKGLNAPDYDGIERQAMYDLFRDGVFSGSDTLYKVDEGAKNSIKEISAKMEENDAGQCAVITHKMVILSILRRYCVPRSSYADWEVPFGGGYLIEYDTIEETAIMLGKI